MLQCQEQQVKGESMTDQDRRYFNVTINLHLDAKAELERRAFAAGFKSVSQYVRHMLNVAYAQQGQPPISFGVDEMPHIGQG